MACTTTQTVSFTTLTAVGSGFSAPGKLVRLPVTAAQTVHVAYVPTDGGTSIAQCTPIAPSGAVGKAKTIAGEKGCSFTARESGWYQVYVQSAAAGLFGNSPAPGVPGALLTVTCSPQSPAACPADTVAIRRATYPTDRWICIDRFEAADNGAGVALSQANLIPWVSVSCPGAASACDRAGKRLCGVMERNDAIMGINGDSLFAAATPYPGLTALAGGVGEWALESTSSAATCTAGGEGYSLRVPMTDNSTSSASVGFRCCREESGTTTTPPPPSNPPTTPPPPGPAGACGQGLYCEGSPFPGAAVCLAGGVSIFCCPSGVTGKNSVGACAVPDCGAVLPGQCTGGPWPGATPCRQGNETVHCCSAGQQIDASGCRAGSPTGACAYSGGTNYRACLGCGWQFCLPTGHWSTDCSPKPSVYPCPTGLSCGGDAICH